MADKSRYHDMPEETAKAFARQLLPQHEVTFRTEGMTVIIDGRRPNAREPFAWARAGNWGAAVTLLALRVIGNKALTDPAVPMAAIDLIEDWYPEWLDVEPGSPPFEPTNIPRFALPTE
jgi:hypothetical protein